jgi:hypothetical protein
MPEHSPQVIYVGEYHSYPSAAAAPEDAGGEGSLDDLVKATIASQHVKTLSPEAAPDAVGEAVPSEPAPVPEEPPPATVQSPAGGTLSYDQEDEIDERAFASADPSRSDVPDSLPKVADVSEGAAESGGGQAMAAADPPPAPTVETTAPAVGTHERTFGGAAMWTDEEDAHLIDLVASGVSGLGLSKSAAIRAAAAELGRPEAGTAFRCHHKLKDRIALALLSQTPPPEPTPAPEIDLGAAVNAALAHRTHPDLEREATLATLHKLDPVADPVADPVTAHLMALPDKGGWTVARDLELMELAMKGWKFNEIALQLTMQANLVQPRFDMLTGLYVDANDKKVRRFSREAVFEDLTKLAQP